MFHLSCSALFCSLTISISLGHALQTNYFLLSRYDRSRSFPDIFFGVLLFENVRSQLDLVFHQVNEKNHYFFSVKPYNVQHNDNNIFIVRMSTTLGLKHFSYTFRFLYFQSRIVGMLPFSIKRNKSGQIIGQHVTFVDIIWFIISIASYIVTTYYANQILSPIKAKIRADDPSFIGGSLISILGIATGISFTIFDMINRNRFFKIFRNFDMFDEQVNIFEFSIRSPLNKIIILNRSANLERLLIIKKLKKLQ